VTLPCPFWSVTLAPSTDRHALLDELLAGEGRDLLVLHGQDARGDLHDRDLGTHRVEEGRELDADGARSR
jgi:hypothetical protein